MDRPLVKNAADARDVKRARQHDKWALERERTDLAHVLETPQGRRFLWKLLSDCGVFKLSFQYGDAQSTAFHEGSRRIGLALMVAIQELDPTLYHRMAKEAHDLEEAYGPPKEDTVKTTTDTKESDDAD